MGRPKALLAGRSVTGHLRQPCGAHDVFEAGVDDVVVVRRGRRSGRTPSASALSRHAAGAAHTDSRKPGSLSGGSSRRLQSPVSTRWTVPASTRMLDDAGRRSPGRRCQNRSRPCWMRTRGRARPSCARCRPDRLLRMDIRSFSTGRCSMTLCAAPTRWRREPSRSSARYESEIVERAGSDDHGRVYSISTRRPIIERMFSDRSLRESLQDRVDRTLRGYQN